MADALHGDADGSSLPDEYQEFAAVEVGRALSLFDGDFFAPIEDCGAKIVKCYHNIFLAVFLMPKEGVKDWMRVSRWRIQMAPSSASGASS